MKIKKILFGSLLAGMMVSALAGCGGDQGGSGTKLTLWVSEADGVVELTKKQVEDFNKSNNAGIKVEATIEKVSEGDAATQMLTDVSAGADIFCFAQDQFARLVQGGALAKVASSVAATIEADNVPEAVAAAKSGDTLYAYPLTADNGYFLYYDKSVLSDAQVGNMETLLTTLEAAGKNISFEMESSAWYLASYFFGAGCKSEWKTNDEGKFISVTDDFNSDKGLIAVKGMQRLVQSPRYVSSSAASDFSAATPSAALVSGTWAFNDVKKVLGDNMGVAELPKFTVGGQDYHLGSYRGFKLMGVKPQTNSEKSKASQLLAQYLTSEKAQLERFNAVAWGPSNKNAKANDDVKAHPALKALEAQNPYATVQGQIHGSWWDIAKVIGTGVKNAKTGDETELKKVLKDYQDAIDALFQMSPEELRAWTVIGSFASLKDDDGEWTVDYEMVEDPALTWTSKDAFELAVGDEFKVRQGKNWDVNVGAASGGNFVVETAGTYKIQFVSNAAEDGGTISLVPAN